MGAASVVVDVWHSTKINNTAAAATDGDLNVSRTILFFYTESPKNRIQVASSRRGARTEEQAL